MTEKKYQRLVTLAIPTRGAVDPKFMIHMISVIDKVPTGTSWKIRVSDKHPKTGQVMDVATARERLIEDCLEHDKSKYILFIDNDVFIPMNGLAHLLMSNKDIVTGIYWTKTDPPEPVLYKELHLGPYFDFPKYSIFEVTAAGLGCCLIKSEIFEKIPKPWFDYQKEDLKDEDGNILDVGEDFYFFIKAQQHGYKLWCNSNVQCKHLKEDIPQKYYP